MAAVEYLAPGAGLLVLSAILAGLGSGIFEWGEHQGLTLIGFRTTSLASLIGGVCLIGIGVREAFR